MQPALRVPSPHLVHDEHTLYLTGASSSLPAVAKRAVALNGAAAPKAPRRPKRHCRGGIKVLRPECACNRPGETSRSCSRQVRTNCRFHVVVLAKFGSLRPTACLWQPATFQNSTKKAKASGPEQIPPRRGQSFVGCSLHRTSLRLSNTVMVQ